MPEQYLLEIQYRPNSVAFSATGESAILQYNPRCCRALTLLYQIPSGHTQRPVRIQISISWPSDRDGGGLKRLVLVGGESVAANDSGGEGVAGEDRSGKGDDENESDGAHDVLLLHDFLRKDNSKRRSLGGRFRPQYGVQSGS